jgi:AmmeMemoRadiSam system protein B
MEFAGSWYPAGPAACRRAIEEFETPQTPPGARLGVAPHAGWTFSGRLAARAYQALAAGGAAELVIVLGGHLRRADPLIVMAEGAWATPFGAFPVHQGFNRRLADLPGVVWETPEAYEADNSTELQLPFARLKFPAAQLLALRVPPSPVALQVGERLAAYLAETGLTAVAVASTDLTHYGPNYRFEPQGRGAAALRWVREENDPAFIRAVEDGSGQAVLEVAQQRHCACSAGGVAALAEVARRQGLRFEALGYATSAEVRPGDATNFVGYLAGVWR